MKIERLIAKGPRDELQGCITDQHLAQRANELLSDDLEIVTWRNLLSRFGEHENPKLEELHIKGKLGEPIAIFQYKTTTVTEQAVWLKHSKEGVENKTVPGSFHGATLQRYLAQTYRDHRRSVASFLLSKLTP